MSLSFARKTNLHFWVLSALLLVIPGCQLFSDKVDRAADRSQLYKDPHSYSNPEVAKIVKLKLDLNVNFEKKMLEGTASYVIDHDHADEIIFDTKNLFIERVYFGKLSAEPSTFEMGEADPVLGTPLRIPLRSDVKHVHIKYRTLPNSEALHWLEPEQTADGKMPFMYTQGQAILTRSWIPIQDSPGIRIEYGVRVKVPEGMLAVMSAENPQVPSEDGTHFFNHEASSTALFNGISGRSSGICRHHGTMWCLCRTLCS